MDIPEPVVNVLIILAGVMSTIIVGYIVLLLKKLAAKVHVELTEKELSIVNTAVDGSIAFVYQTYVSGIKRASDDGKLTTEEAKLALSKATSEIKDKIMSLNINKVLSDEDIKKLIESRLPIFNSRVG